MRFRKLRIVWSVVWSVAAVLLIVLWVRSYSHRTTSEILVTPSFRYYLHSFQGTVAIEKDFREFIGAEVMFIREESDYLPFVTGAGLKIIRGWNGTNSINAVCVSYWLLLVANVIVAGASWVAWSKRFALRTLLIATTLVAI